MMHDVCLTSLDATAAKLLLPTMKQRGLLNSRSPHADRIVAKALKQAGASDEALQSLDEMAGDVSRRRRLGELEPGQLEIDGCFGESIELFAEEFIIF